MIIFACRDCRFVRDEDVTEPMCGHEASLGRLTDYYLGRIIEVRRSINIMRTIGPCGPEAKLFEPKEPEP